MKDPKLGTAHRVGEALLEVLDKIEAEDGTLDANEVIDGIKDFTAAVLVESNASINRYVIELRTTHAEASIFASFGTTKKIGEA